MVSRGNAGIQQKLVSFSFPKVPEGTFAVDEYRNSISCMCFPKPVNEAVVVTELFRLCTAQLSDMLFTPTAVVGWCVRTVTGRGW